MNKPGSAEKHDHSPEGDRERTLVFCVGSERFGLPLVMVVEVFELNSPLMSVPGAPEWIAGVINHHGQVVPVLRMSAFLDASSPQEPEQIILVELSGESLGLAVDQIEALEEVRAEGPALQGRRRSWHRGALMELIDTDYIQGSIQRRLAEIGRQSII
jgi:chemotaxis signal transduction protein